jgi:hypothetical protein
MQGNPQLTQIANAMDSVCFCFGSREGWQKECREDSDDGDDNQQFHEGKCRGALACRSSHHLIR